MAHEADSLESLSMKTVKKPDVLERKLDLFRDETFDSAADGLQLYTNHAMPTDSRTVSLVFCVTKHKNEEPMMQYGLSSRTKEISTSKP